MCARATYAADAASEILVVLVVTGGINQEKACNTAHRFGITVCGRLGWGQFPYIKGRFAQAVLVQGAANHKVIVRMYV